MDEPGSAVNAPATCKTIPTGYTLRQVQTLCQKFDIKNTRNHHGNVTHCSFLTGKFPAMLLIRE